MMFISRKKFERLEKRVADLEAKDQGKPLEAMKKTMSEVFGIKSKDAKEQSGENQLQKFEVIKKITDPKKFSELIFDIIKIKQTPEEFTELLTEEINEEGLQTLESIVQNNYPLSLERKQ